MKSSPVSWLKSANELQIFHEHGLSPWPWKDHYESTSTRGEAWICRNGDRNSPFGQEWMQKSPPRPWRRVQWHHKPCDIAIFLAYNRHFVRINTIQYNWRPVLIFKLKVSHNMKFHDNLNVNGLISGENIFSFSLICSSVTSSPWNSFRKYSGKCNWSEYKDDKEDILYLEDGSLCWLIWTCLDLPLLSYYSHRNRNCHSHSQSHVPVHSLHRIQNQYHHSNLC